VSAELEPRAIEAYLHRRIPIAAVMGIRIRAADAHRVRLAAPFAPNINAEPDGGGASPEAEGGPQAAGAQVPGAVGDALPGAARDEVVFGGSAVAVAILAAWTLLYVRERMAGGRARLVIQRSTIHYERPITGDFEAACEMDDEAAYARFRRMFERHGRGRITLRSTLLQNGVRAAAFEGDFVALR